MGGCRCTFRGCQNSTASSPGKHFFHYPTKDPERTKKWITFSNNFSFLDLDDSKLRNRNVCEDHFRVHMFMNIKKERLIRVAYPTLLKILKTGKVYDLEKMKEDNKLDATMTVKSEFDDEFDQYLVEDHENPTIVNLTTEETSSDSTKRESFSLNEQNIADIPIEFCDVNPKSVTQEPVKKIPEKIILTPVKKVLKRPAISENNSIVLTSVPIKKLKPCIKILNSTNIMKTISTETREIEPTISTNITPTTKILNSETSQVANLLKAQNETLEKLKKVTQEKDLLRENEQKATLELEQSNIKIISLELKVMELQRELKEAKEEKRKPIMKSAKFVQTDPEPKKTIPKTETSPITQGTPKPSSLTKPQLFNGIKRYLSNAMSTLLKMEMFGNNEREWKSDEKKISCEIMRLGKDVYEYFTDEWRLRLPAKTEVNNWLQDNADEDDEDLF